MSIYLIFAIIAVIYYRTWNYKMIVDDNIDPRGGKTAYSKGGGYLYENTEADNMPPIEFYNTSPSLWFRFFMIGQHCLITFLIYTLWGWVPALLFAVHPMAAWGTAWYTGSHYASATLLVLISFYFLTTFNTWWSIAIAAVVYSTALNCTIQPIFFPFFLLATGNFIAGSVMLVPLAMFMFGERFQFGYASRHRNMEELFGQIKFNARRPLMMVKVVRMYVNQFFFPKTCSMFNPIGYETREGAASYTEMHRCNKDFWVALGICLSAFTFGCLVDWKATFWTFGILAVHSQYKIIGQFFAQRYLYMGMIGFCIVLGKFLTPYPIALAVIATALIYRTVLFIPHFKDMESFYRGELAAYPEFSGGYKNLAGFLILQGIFSKLYRKSEIVYLLNKGNYEDPNDWGVHQNFSCFFDRLGHIDLALFHMERVNEIAKSGGAPKILIDETDFQIASYKSRIESGELANRPPAKEIIKVQEPVGV